MVDSVIELCSKVFVGMEYTKVVQLEQVWIPPAKGEMCRRNWDVVHQRSLTLNFSCAKKIQGGRERGVISSKKVRLTKYIFG